MTRYAAVSAAAEVILTPGLSSSSLHRQVGPRHKHSTPHVSLTALRATKSTSCTQPTAATQVVATAAHLWPVHLTCRHRL